MDGQQCREFSVITTRHSHSCLHAGLMHCMQTYSWYTLTYNQESQFLKISFKMLYFFNVPTIEEVMHVQVHIFINHLTVSYTALSPNSLLNSSSLNSLLYGFITQLPLTRRYHPTPSYTALSPNSLLHGSIT